MKKRLITKEGMDELASKSTVYYDALIATTKEFQQLYAQRILATGPSKLGIAFHHFVSNGDEWAGAITAAFSAGHLFAAEVMVRCALENAANILYVATVPNECAPEELADRYLGHGERMHQKLVVKADSFIRARIQRGESNVKSPEQMDRLRSDIASKVDAHQRRHGRYGSRWVDLSFEDMLSTVIDHLPSWAIANEELMVTIQNSVPLWNFGIHATAFHSPRGASYYTAENLLVFETAAGTNPSHLAALLAMNNWLVMAETLGGREELERALTEKVDVLSEPTLRKHIKPAMIRID